MRQRIEVWGPSAGSSLIVLEYDPVHSRIILKASTDFATTNCVLHKEHARKLRDALNELLGEP